MFFFLTEKLSITKAISESLFPRTCGITLDNVSGKKREREMAIKRERERED